MKEKYKNLSDEELISVLRDGDKEAIDILLEKYKSMVLGKAKSMYILGGDSDDLIQEGMLGLFKAVRDYDCGRDVSFKTFAQLCVNRQILIFSLSWSLRLLTALLFSKTAYRLLMLPIELKNALKRRLISLSSWSRWRAKTSRSSLRTHGRHSSHARGDRRAN